VPPGAPPCGCSPYSEAGGQVQCRRRFEGKTSSGLKPVFIDLDRCAIAPPGEEAILVPAQLGHALGEPQPGSDERGYEQEGGCINDHPMAVVIALAAPRIFGEVIAGRRRHKRTVRASGSAAEAQDPMFAIRRRRAVIAHPAKISTRRRPSGR
jgi:hypothetical protein